MSTGTIGMVLNDVDEKALKKAFVILDLIFKSSSNLFYVYVFNTVFLSVLPKTYNKPM